MSQPATKDHKLAGFSGFHSTSARFACCRNTVYSLGGDTNACINADIT